MKFGDLDKLAAALRQRNDKDFQRGEVWQAILNLGYSQWRGNEDWTYDDMAR